MPILRKIKRKENGVEETVHLGALAQNITQDATHRFVTDTEKQAWNSKPGSTSGLDNNVVTFTEAATRENLQSGEKLSISLGKIKKWFSDLGAAAFMAVANNCTTTQPGSVLAAEQGKKLQDQISQVSSELKFPDGTKFYPDIQDGEYGFNTAADRGADTFHPFKADWELVLKITFGAASNNKGGIYSNDDAATDTPHGWYSSMNSTIRCVNGEITVTGKCACAGRFGNQNDVAGYISNITVVSFSYL